MLAAAPGRGRDDSRLGTDPHARGRPPYGRGAWRLGESVDGDYATVVWLACSMGIVAGALGSSLDGEEAVLQATYSRREQARQASKRA